MATSQEKKHVELFRVVLPVRCNTPDEIDMLDENGEKYIDSSDYPNYFFKGSLEETFRFAVSKLEMRKNKKEGDGVVFWPLGQTGQHIARIGIEIHSTCGDQVSRFSFMDDRDSWYFNHKGEIRYDHEDEDDYRYIV